MAPRRLALIDQAVLAVHVELLGLPEGIGGTVSSLARLGEHSAVVTVMRIPFSLQAGPL
jgi:hypothetical protein